MSIVIADSVTQIFGAEEVLTNVSFSLAADSRVGLVGPNGGGKTTLLRILAGQLEPTSGEVRKPASVRVGYLPQEPPALAGTTLHEAMLEAFDDVRRMQRELESLAARLEGDKASTARYGRLQVEFEARGGYDYAHRTEAVLSGLGFRQDQWSQPLSELSGGQRTRAYLGRLLLAGPDLLLLDEPTNHLDLASLEWLERWLAAYGGALVLVSHDRYFLDRTTDQTWEVGFTALEQYRGPYSQYLAKREDRFRQRLSQWEAQQRYIADTEDFIARNLAGQRSREAQGRRTRLERFLKTEAIPRPRQHRKVHISLAGAGRTGDMVLQVEDLVIGYSKDRPLMRIDSLKVLRGRKIAVVGSNGTGKTTLLKTLLGKLEPLAGKARCGTNVRFGYLSQTHEDLDAQSTALGALQAATGLKARQARDLLGGLLLGGDDVLKTVSQLSGGQRSRVIIAVMIAQEANVLLLDEPTNHLDIPSQEILQQVLQEFGGTIIFVSHDRYLIDAVATDIWAMDGEGISPLPGRWEAYLAWRSGQAGQGAASARADDADKLSRKDAYKHRRRRQNELQRMQRTIDELEGSIDLLESELKKLHDDISAAGESGNIEQVERLGRQYGLKHAELRELNGRWETLSEQIASAQSDQA